MKRWFLLIGFVISFAAGAATTFAVQRWTASSDITPMVERAKTPADHDNLAKYFERQAADNAAKAAFHARLEKAYDEAHPDWKLAMHCEEMSRYFGSIAEQDSALAAEHRRLARETQ